MANILLHTGTCDIGNYRYLYMISQKLLNMIQDLSFFVLQHFAEWLFLIVNPINVYSIDIEKAINKQGLSSANHNPYEFVY